MPTDPPTNRPEPCWVCVDCLFWHANAELPEDPERAEEVRAGGVADGSRWTLGRFHGPDGCGTEHPDDTDDATECETVTFSWNACHACRSPFGGSRHAMTYWPEEPEPVLECAECGEPVDGGDGVSIDGLAFCGKYYGNGCGDRILRDRADGPRPATFWQEVRAEDLEEHGLDVLR